MPELPDLALYQEHIETRARGRELRGIRLGSPFVLRTVEPPPLEFAGRVLEGTERIGKRIVLAFDGERYAVLHLMVLGRLSWRLPQARLAKGTGLVSFDFDHGCLQLGESGHKRRASLHLVRGAAALAQFQRGGIEPLVADAAAFAAALTRENFTLKRALTDPAVVAGVGNAYSDEILHRARLSPFKQTHALSAAELQRLHAAAQQVLQEWTRWLREEAGDRWPSKVTAFHKGMAVHGKFGQPCPVCGAPVQRIVHADNECNYCPGCQTGGRILADRALSRLLKDSWPRTLDDL
ncbi:MAG TPA: DNA-formamidopyrimidine glycosylase family protein [Candidatus Binatia bacterium]|nr:DNA-formamidopyrimidine glycosylase family protein [Candidatus Binatia bacterium]